MNSASRTLASLIEASNGKFVTVDCVKKDGSFRTMNGRLGVVKALKGGVATKKPAQYITLYDNAKKAYRSVNRDTILRVSVGGVVAVAA